MRFSSCAIGCSVAAVGGAVLVLLGLRWLVGGEQITTATIVGEDTVGVFQVDRLREDQGSRELLVYLLSEFERVGAEQGSRNEAEYLDRMKEYNRPDRDRGYSQLLSYTLPKEMTFVLEPVILEPVDAAESAPEEVGAGDRRAWVGAINLAFFSRNARWYLDGKTEEVANHRGHFIGRLDTYLLFAFHDDTLLISRRRQALERVIDRLEDRAPLHPSAGASGREGADQAFRQKLASPMASPWVPEDRGHFDFYGSVLNPGGAQNDWLMRLEKTLLEVAGAGESDGSELPEARGDEVEGIFFGFDVLSADRVKVELVLACTDLESAQRWRARLQGLLAPPPLSSTPIQLLESLAVEVKSSPQGPVVRGEFELQGIREVGTRFFQRKGGRGRYGRAETLD
ncbi:MAG: hypothetical protein AAGD01_14280 [Acidobacteriota bacterium]